MTLPSDEPTQPDPENAPHPGETDRTGMAPPFIEPMGRQETISHSQSENPEPGQRLDDFELVQLLGTGSFARVFLARQVSLGRLVALKVSRNRGQEARTMATLEHDHIVRVFSEVVVRDRDLRLLCMQYVPGTTLQRIIADLLARPLEQRSGRTILDIIDTQATDPAALDLGALRDREALAGMDLIEAGCWMGARLAEALALAHGLGVLHRDVKPANILVNRYGRPLLADFNVSGGKINAEAGEEMFGGTLPYMSPEHLDAFNAEDLTPASAVDARSDVYSLGVVLYELFTGRLPYEPPTRVGRNPQLLTQMSDQRREGVPRLALDAPPALERVIARCLAPSPLQRYQDASALAIDLDSCRELHRVQGDLPPGWYLTRWATRWPFLVGALLVFLPHLIGSLVNISYNALQIVRGLTPDQQRMFLPMVLFYNAIVYPCCLVVVFSRVAIVRDAWKRLRGGERIEPVEIDEARRQALKLPGLGCVLSCLGWLPGGVIFPMILDAWAEPLPWPMWGHFLFSFTISGLIALTYSVLALEFVVVRVLYPGLWLDARQMRETARRELRWVEVQTASLQFGAVLIPLAGAIMAVVVGPKDFDGESYQTFRLLVTALLGVGMSGLGLALLAGSELRRTVSVLVGGTRRA